MLQLNLSLLRIMLQYTRLGLTPETSVKCLIRARHCSFDFKSFLQTHEVKLLLVPFTEEESGCREDLNSGRVALEYDPGHDFAGNILT